MNPVPQSGGGPEAGGAVAGVLPLPGARREEPARRALRSFGCNPVWEEDGRVIPPAVVAAIMAAVEAEAGQPVRVLRIEPLGPAPASPSWAGGGAAGILGRNPIAGSPALPTAGGGWPQPWALAGRQELMAAGTAMQARPRRPHPPAAQRPDGRQQAPAQDASTRQGRKDGRTRG